MDTDDAGTQILLSYKEEKIEVCSINHIENGQESMDRAGIVKEFKARPGVHTAEIQNEPCRNVSI